MFFKKPQDETASAAAPTSGAAGPTETAAAKPETAKPDASTAAAAPVVLDAEEAKKRAAASKRMAASFGEIVSLLMRSPADKHHTLADLEWLIAPAVMRGQFAVAEAQSKETGATAPIGAVLWAFVSEEVDARLTDLATPMRLKPDEWRSGDIPWIIHATGDTRVIAGLIQQLTASVLKGKAPKMRARGSDGKVTVGHIEIKEKTSAEN